MNSPSVLLITGPAGSGKSTLAEKVSHELGWHYIPEDDYWVARGWTEGARSDEQEAIIQQTVWEDLLTRIVDGQGVVLEFILYKNPPNPLMEYQQRLKNAAINYATVALKPSVDVIMQRLISRGRSEDISDLENRRIYAESQVRCLEQDYVRPFSVDSSTLSLEQLCSMCIEKIHGSRA